MSRSLGAKNHDIRRCEFCDELFCVTCSNADDDKIFCSEDCELDARRESADRELTLALDCAARARDMMGGL